MAAQPPAASHTRRLHLDGVRPSIYTSVPARWLGEVLRGLPGLHVLTLTDFPFLDHAALLQAPAVLAGPHRQLRELTATGCLNASAPGWVALLGLLPALCVLDLSGSSGANQPAVLAAAVAAPAPAPGLHTLALRDLRLTDATLGTLVAAVGTRLRSLDVRGNLLSDASAAVLLDYAFAPPSYLASCPRPARRSPPPCSLAAAAGVQGDERGITHLRIADNSLTAAGASKLLKSARLVTFDIGQPRRPRRLANCDDDDDADDDDDVLQLVPVLSLYAHTTLRTLRISHHVVMPLPRRASVAPTPLRRAMLPALRTLVLTGVPEWAPRRQADALCAFIASPPRPPEDDDQLQVLELEMETASSAAAAAEAEGAWSDDFSFFHSREDGHDAGEGGAGSGTSWVSDHSGPAELVETLRQVKELRDAKTGWRGRIRIVRDLGGRESCERGIEGERWGLVREGM